MRYQLKQQETRLPISISTSSGPNQQSFSTIDYWKCDPNLGHPCSKATVNSELRYFCHRTLRSLDLVFSNAQRQKRRFYSKINTQLPTFKIIWPKVHGNTMHKILTCMKDGCSVKKSDWLHFEWGAIIHLRLSPPISIPGQRKTKRKDKEGGRKRVPTFDFSLPSAPSQD